VRSQQLRGWPGDRADQSPLARASQRRRARTGAAEPAGDVMTRVESLLEHLVDAFTATAPEAGMAVTGLSLDVPVEAAIAEDGALLMTLPRGLLATGFEPPLGRLRLHCAGVA